MQCWEQNEVIVVVEKGQRFSPLNDSNQPPPWIRYLRFLSFSKALISKCLIILQRNLFIHSIYLFFRRFKVFKAGERIVDTGYLIDKTLNGGRLGLYVFSQSNVVWKNMFYKCNGKLD